MERIKRKKNHFSSSTSVWLFSVRWYAHIVDINIENVRRSSHIQIRHSIIIACLAHTYDFVIVCKHTIYTYDVRPGSHRPIGRRFKCISWCADFYRTRSHRNKSLPKKSRLIYHTRTHIFVWLSSCTPLSVSNFSIVVDTMTLPNHRSHMFHATILICIDRFYHILIYFKLPTFPHIFHRFFSHSVFIFHHNEFRALLSEWRENRLSLSRFFQSFDFQCESMETRPTHPVVFRFTRTRRRFAEHMPCALCARQHLFIV